ncbi:hypothetical protein U9M48_022849, partial [Paspalum notatum var. saurae]
MSLVLCFVYPLKKKHAAILSLQCLEGTKDCGIGRTSAVQGMLELGNGLCIGRVRKTKWDAHTGHICKNMFVDERSTCALTCSWEKYKYQ